MTPETLKAVIKQAQDGDPEAFVTLVATLQRDLRVLIATYASSKRMVDAIIVEVWSYCRAHLDQCPASAAAPSWLRMTACAHLLRHLETEQKEVLASADDLQFPITHTGLEQFSATPSPSNVHGLKVNEKIKQLDAAAQALLERRYARGLRLEACAGDAGGSAAEVARSLFIVRDMLDWREAGQVLLAGAAGDFALLIEEFMTGSMAAPARARLLNMVAQDKARAAQFERQVRLDLVLSALLAGAGVNEARSLVGRLPSAAVRSGSPSRVATDHTARPAAASSARSARRGASVHGDDKETSQRSAGRKPPGIVWFGAGAIALAVVLLFALRGGGAPAPAAAHTPQPEPAPAGPPPMPAIGVGQEAPHSATKITLDETFDKGVIPPSWLTQGQQWQVTPDPEPTKTANQVLAVSALDSHVAVLTIADHALGDGTLRFRMRYHTSFPTIMSPGKNDGVHFPHWRLNFMPQNEGKGLVFIDDVVWASLRLAQGEDKKVERAGLRPQERWIRWAIALRNGVCTASQDGEQIMLLKCDSAFNSGLSFSVMHAQLWLDDISFTP